MDGNKKNINCYVLTHEKFPRISYKYNDNY